MSGSGPSWRVRGYAVEQLLGSGAGGEVWRGRALPSGDAVALKRVIAVDPEQLRRAAAEAAVLTALDHQHIVRLHAVVPSDEHLVLVLDLAEGGSLADLLGARGRLTTGEVITALAPVGAALAYLHDEGVVHGDVSAANILFTAAGRALLADVGTARLTGDVSDAMSTPAYVDPAVAAGCVPGPPSDVFMLGAVALHALTGAPPWDASTADTALAQAAAATLPDLADRLAAAGVPQRTATVIRRALTVDPHRRGTAAEFALDLRHSGQPVAVELAAGRMRPAPRPAEPLSGVRPGPRHAAGVVSSEPRRRRRAGRTGPGDQADRAPGGLDRPAFDRPAFDRPAPGGAGAAAPTSQVGPRPRPVIARPEVGSRWRARRTAAVIATAAVLGLAGAGTAWWLARTPDARARTAVSATTWITRLDALDRTRERAFATRNAGLLARVYRPGPLLQADAALLTRIVPAGCGLTGARTSYREVRIAVHDGAARVNAVAVLAASRLVCGTTVAGTAPGTLPTHLVIELVDTAAGPRIADEQLA